MSDLEGPDEGSFGEHLIENMFTTWIDGDLARRCAGLGRADVLRAVVELPPFAGNPIIRINDEATLQARAVAATRIRKGDPVTAENIRDLESFWPVDVHPNSGWLAYLVVGGAAYVAFDLRYNKQRTAELLGLADKYFEVVEAVMDRALRPAVDNLLSAAELAVQAQMLAESRETKFHHARDKWLRQDERMGNAPEGVFELLRRLRNERAAARYGDGQLSVRLDEMPNLVAQVREMIAHAATRVGVESVDD